MVVISVVSSVTLQQHPVTFQAISFSLHLADSKLFLWSCKTFEWLSMKTGQEANEERPKVVLILRLAQWLRPQEHLVKTRIMWIAVFKWAPVEVSSELLLICVLVKDLSDHF